MKWTKEEIIDIISECECRMENPDYKSIMDRFVRYLNGETRCVRLSKFDKDILRFIYDGDDSWINSKKDLIRLNVYNKL